MSREVVVGTNLSPSRRAPYGAVKDQLVSLSLEIEFFIRSPCKHTPCLIRKDCTEAAKLLREAIHREQVKAREISQNAGAPFQQELEAADAKHRESLAAHLRGVDKLLERKKVLSSDAKLLLEQIKEERAQTTVAVEEVLERGKNELQQAQETWAEGEDMRREKWMERRTREVRELTLKGLEPEIEIIMEKHKADIKSTEEEHHQRALILRKEISLRGEESLREEKARARYQMETSQQEYMEAFSKRKQAVMDKHQADLERERKRAAGEAETQRRWQEEEMRRVEGTTLADVTRLRNEEHSRLQEMRLKHSEDMAAAGRRRTASIASLARQADLDRQGWERRTKEEAVSEGEKATELERDRLMKERDAKVKDTLRRLESERSAFERSNKTDLEKEESRLNESHAEAVRQLADKQAVWERRQEDCTSSLHILVDTRREVSLKVQGLVAELGLLSQRASKAEATSKEGARKARDEEERALREHHELVSERKSHRADLEKQIREREKEAAEVNARSQLEQATLKKKHELRLESLHLEVKEKITLHDETISALREAVHTEGLRAEHAAKMLAKYRKRVASVVDKAGETCNAPRSSAPATRAASNTTTSSPATNGSSGTRHGDRSSRPPVN